MRVQKGVHAGQEDGSGEIDSMRCSVSAFALIMNYAPHNL